MRKYHRGGVNGEKEMTQISLYFFSPCDNAKSKPAYNLQYFCCIPTQKKKGWLHCTLAYYAIRMIFFREDQECRFEYRLLALVSTFYDTDV